MKEKLTREISRMSEKEKKIATKSEESFFEWLVKIIVDLFGAITEGIQDFLEWLFNLLRGSKR